MSNASRRVKWCPLSSAVVPVFAVAIALLSAAGVHAQADISADGITFDPDPAVMGWWLDMTLMTSNLGPGPDSGATGEIRPALALDFEPSTCLPNLGVYMGGQSYYLQQPLGAVEWFFDAPDPADCVLWFNTWGDGGGDDGVLWNDQYWIECGLGQMDPGGTAEVILTAPIAMSPPPVDTLLEINSGPSQGQQLANFPAIFGQRIDQWDVTADVELVDDGTADPTLGCSPPIGFTAGNIALIDRGACEFGDKAVFAEAAGATAVIIANDLASQYPGDQICTNWGAGVLGGPVTIPVVFIGYDDGQTLRTLPPPTNLILQAVFPAGNWTLGVTGGVLNQLNDPNTANDAVGATVTVDVTLVFADGFETGDMSMWSMTVP